MTSVPEMLLSVNETGDCPKDRITLPEATEDTEITEKFSDLFGQNIRCLSLSVSSVHSVASVESLHLFSPDRESLSVDYEPLPDLLRRLASSNSLRFWWGLP